jgi:formylglycine-generating enzyme required for sulfatase activity/serine/threonine protein kinase
MTTATRGRVIAGRYRVISQLAAGGMGVTYRAWDLRAGCPVVIKMPKVPKDDIDGTKGQQLANRFVQEIKAMQALAHEHIVPITDSGDDAGVPYVAMRFLPGGSLADHRRKRKSGGFKPAPAGLLHFWLMGIAEALDFIHSRGVVHRDVKPANVFFDGFRRGFLGDFGIAKVVDESAGLAKGETLTGTQFAVGTPEYMAPELLIPRAKPDGRADQYALAISVYEMLAGKRPFTGESAHIVVEHATLPVPPLDRKPLRLPASLAVAVERALSKKPDERFESCGAFARAALADVRPQPNEPGVVRLLCPSCRRILKMPVSAAGRTGTCPRCKTDVEVAADLSALWETAEAGVVAEEQQAASATPFGFRPARGSSTAIPNLLQGAAERAAGFGAEGDEGRPSSGLSFGQWALAVGIALMVTLVSAGVGFGGASWWWSSSHTQQLAALNAEVDQQRREHATAVAAAEQAQADAVAAVAAKSQATIEEAKHDLAGKLAAATTARDAAEAELQQLGQQIASARVERDRLADELNELNGPDEIANSIGMQLKLIPAGTFSMGSANGDSDEQPVHEVTISRPYYLGVTEVTNGQWQAVMRDVPSKWKNADLPVESVSWEDAATFCNRLSSLPAERRAGRVYRLPTEAEWEYACRAGTTTAYSFGDDKSLLGDFAWYPGNSGRQTHPVGQKRPNAWGLYDMHGNVWEWCSDLYGDYAAGAVRDPAGPATGSLRVLRGGSWSYSAGRCRSAFRGRGNPSNRDSRVGFRLALSPSGASSPEASE